MSSSSSSSTSSIMMPIPTSSFGDNQQHSRKFETATTTVATTSVSSAVAVEDCRDYLRTGRCKYGSSCKYNHPLNVQNGGGMKAPLDPTEPLFPIRPHEPVCQYYMKHATCKFGQACKFHHPPQHAGGASAASSSSMMHGTVVGGNVIGINMGGGQVGGGGGPIFMNVGRGCKIIDASPPLILNPLGTDNSGSAMMMQLLPQRPDEPDCIYFLKNGRCKYGATCRYHHPVNYQQQQHHQQRRIVEEQSRQDRSTTGGGGRVGHAPFQQQKQQHHPLQHQQQLHDPYSIPFVQYMDGPLTFVSVDGSQTTATATTTYKPVSLVPGGEGFPMYAVGSTVATEQGSTTSSIASSYDTGNSSSLDQHLHLAGAGDTSSAALWNRAKKNRSGGSLNAHISAAAAAGGGGGGGMAPRGTIPTVRSDGSIARRGRVGSYGSASDHHGSAIAHFDANLGAGSTSTTVASNIVRTSALNTEASPGATMWRPDRSSSSFEQVRRIPTGAVNATGHYVMEAEGQLQQQQSPTIHRGRPPMRGGAVAQPRRSSRHGATNSRSGDEGFTRMTSALLNMLDTPEETSADMYSDEGSYRYGFDEPDTTRMLEGLSMQDHVEQPQYQHRGGHPTIPPRVIHPHDGDAAQWSPTWHGSSAGPGTAHHHNPRTMSNAMHPSQHPPSPNSEHSDFVGLYLP
jgi:hypothetical protein